MTTAARGLRPWIVPELKLVDLTARTRLSEEERRRIAEVMQATTATSTSNVPGMGAFGGPTG